jgi:predicted aspartyl protease
VTCEIANPVDRRRSVDVPNALVDTGSECTWIPRHTLERIGVIPEKSIAFVLTNGQRITRDAGFALIRIANFVTADDVVFGEPGDLCVLGARTLEGLNLTVDAAKKRLVPGGPHPAALANL